MEKLHLFYFKQSIVLNRVIQSLSHCRGRHSGGGKGIAEAHRSVINIS